jgi:predicted transcriptional regulator
MRRDIKVIDLVEKLELRILAGKDGLDRPVEGGHCGDLLSEVMANAPSGCIWVTIQQHKNIVAVAVLREIAAVIVAGAGEPDDDTCQKADEEQIPVLHWPGSVFDLVGQLFDAGVDNHVASANGKSP